MVTNHIVLETIVIRIKWLFSTLTAIAIAVAAHEDLLPYSQRTRSLIQLVCLIIISMSNSPIGKFTDPRHEEDRRT